MVSMYSNQWMKDKWINPYCVVRIGWFPLPIKMLCHDGELNRAPVIYLKTIT
jgi:hypothetical protein